MSSLSISAAWEETKAILAHDAQLYLSVALALVVLPQVVQAVAGSPMDSGGSNVTKVVYVAVVLIELGAQIALNRLALGPSVPVSCSITQRLVRLVPVFLLLPRAPFLMPICPA